MNGCKGAHRNHVQLYPAPLKAVRCRQHAFVKALVFVTINDVVIMFNAQVLNKSFVTFRYSLNSLALAVNLQRYKHNLFSGQIKEGVILLSSMSFTFQVKLEI